MNLFVAVLAPPGAEVDRPLVGALTASLAPAASEPRVHHDGRAGLGSVRVLDAERLSAEAPVEGGVRIVADARLVARGELVSALRAVGRQVDAATPDEALVGHAYHAWGEECLDRLRGDFAFLVWNPRRNSLFCARDHFGAVPLYYAEVEGAVVVSNSLDAVRRHPGVGTALNERAVGDYLLFGCNQEPATTFFADVRRVPPAHAVTWTSGPAGARCYWRLPPAEPVPRAAAEVRETYLAVLRAAVADRLGPGPAGSPMSGGLDSTSIAALAMECARDRAGVSIGVHVTGFSKLLPDDERDHAAAVARAIGAPLHVYDGDAFLFDRIGPRAWNAPPEPRFPLLRSPIEAIISRVAADGGGVVLWGMGGDPALRPAPRKWRARTPAAVRRRIRRLRGSPARPEDRPLGPSWLEPDFARRHRLSARWRHVLRTDAMVSGRRALVERPYWEQTASSGHPEFHGLSLTSRYPFFDVRLLEFLQTVPPDPWFVGKRLAREALRGRLPEATMRRPKAPLLESFHYALARRRRDPWLEDLAASSALAPFVAREPLRGALREPGSLEDHTYVQRVLLPLGLAHWLHTRAPRPTLAARESDPLTRISEGQR